PIWLDMAHQTPRPVEPGFSGRAYRSGRPSPTSCQTQRTAPGRRLNYAGGPAQDHLHNGRFPTRRRYTVKVTVKPVDQPADKPGLLASLADLLLKVDRPRLAGRVFNGSVAEILADLHQALADLDAAAADETLDPEGRAWAQRTREVLAALEQRVVAIQAEAAKVVRP